MYQHVLSHFEFQNETIVLDYLLSRKELMDTLEDLLIKIKRFFGIGTRLTLELCQCEPGACNTKLFVVIKSDENPLYTERKLLAFERKYWNRESGEGYQNILLDVEWGEELLSRVVA